MAFGQNNTDSLNNTFIYKLNNSSDTINIYFYLEGCKVKRWEKYQIFKQDNNILMKTFSPISFRKLTELGFGNYEKIINLDPSHLLFKPNVIFNYTTFNINSFAQFEILGEKIGVVSKSPGELYRYYIIIFKKFKKVFSNSNSIIKAIENDAIPRVDD
jgi:hypothetical protein